MKRIVYSWCAVIVLAAATASARADAIDRYVNDPMRELRLPGVALAVVRGGEIITIRCFGSADLEHAVPVSEDSVFEIGSLTKQLTDVALMMLVEEGKVALDDSVTKHLPQLPPTWAKITVRHLLTHSSGIQEYLSVPRLPERARGQPRRKDTPAGAEVKTGVRAR